MHKFFFVASLFPVALFSLEEKPWFGNFLEFEFRAEYNYNFFNKVQEGVPQLTSIFQTHEVAFDLELTAPEDWSWEMELEFADTSTVSWGYRSFALQARKLWLDDVCGDCLSLATGAIYRHVSSRMLKALSTPYHGTNNLELNASFGREWSCGCYWYFRIYGFFAVGQANRGFPWLRGDLFFWANYEDCHQFRLYGQSYWGLGHRRIVNLDRFRGFAKIGHQSIDLGASYRYMMGICGSLQFDYLHRVYARSYPEHVNFFIFTYKLPFCPF